MYRRETALNVHRVDIQCTQRNLQQASVIKTKHPQHPSGKSLTEIHQVLALDLLYPFSFPTV